MFCGKIFGTSRNFPTKSTSPFVWNPEICVIFRISPFETILCILILLCTGRLCIFIHLWSTIFLEFILFVKNDDNNYRLMLKYDKNHMAAIFNCNWFAILSSFSIKQSIPYNAHLLIWLALLFADSDLAVLETKKILCPSKNVKGEFSHQTSFGIRNQMMIILNL